MDSKKENIFFPCIPKAKLLYTAWGTVSVVATGTTLFPHTQHTCTFPYISCFLIRTNTHVNINIPLYILFYKHTYIIILLVPLYIAAYEPLKCFSLLLKDEDKVKTIELKAAHAWTCQL